MDVSLYEPARVFLFQGSSAAADALAASIIVDEPFAHVLSVPRFTIDHARALVAFNTEDTTERRTYFVSFSVFSPEAAQVLLKTLEEPAPHTYYILVTPYPYLVPATIRSRTMLLSLPSDTPISLPTKNRTAMLEYIKEEFGSDSDDDAATKRARAVELLDALETHVRATPEKASIVYEAKGMLFGANMPTKYILEYAASMVL